MCVSVTSLQTNLVYCTTVANILSQRSVNYVSKEKLIPLTVPQRYFQKTTKMVCLSIRVPTKLPRDGEEDPCIPASDARMLA